MPLPTQIRWIQNGQRNIRNIAEYIRELKEQDELSALHGYRFHLDCLGCGAVRVSQRFICACSRLRCGNCVKRAQHPCTYVRLIEDEDGSRRCGICFNENPHHRAMFKQCGHVMCRACVIMVMVTCSSEPVCPYCRAHTPVTFLFEDRETYFTKFVALVYRYFFVLIIGLALFALYLLL